MEDTDQELENLLHYLNLPGALGTPVLRSLRFSAGKRQSSPVVRLIAGAGGAAQSQRAVQGQGGRLAGGEASGGGLFGGGADAPDDGNGEPGGGERAVEVADALASPDDLFEPGGAGLVGGRVAGLRAPGKGGAEQEGVAANELPADVEELAQRVGGRGSVKVGGVDGGEGFGSCGVKEGGDQGVA